MVSIRLVKELTYTGPTTEPSSNSPIQHPIGLPNDLYH
jgi:hypothetical protein